MKYKIGDIVNIKYITWLEAGVYEIKETSYNMYGISRINNGITPVLWHVFESGIEGLNLGHKNRQAALKLLGLK